MTKDELGKDAKFMRICSKYDVYSKSVTVYGDLILLNSSTRDLYILLDKDYNTIAIEKAYITNLDKFINSLYQEYIEYSKNLCFSYPFDKLTFKQIVDISNRITLTKEEDKITMIINGIGCIYKISDDYSRVLAYIKFLGKEIKNYQSYIFINKKMGIGVINVTSYISLLINKINDFIELSIKNKKAPTVEALIEYINNEDFEYYEYKFLLNEVISLLLKQKGYKIENEKLEKIPISNISNLSEKAYQLLEVLKTPNFDFRHKIKNYQQEAAKDIFEVISLEEKTFTTKKAFDAKKYKKSLTKRRIWHRF